MYIITMTEITNNNSSTYVVNTYQSKTEAQQRVDEEVAKFKKLAGLVEYKITQNNNTTSLILGGPNTTEIIYQFTIINSRML